MKIIILEWDGYCYLDMCAALTGLGHTLIKSAFPKNNPKGDPEYEGKLTELIETNHPDFIFSFNYFPLTARVAKNTETKYVSWVYDNPQVLLYSYTIIYPTNYVFLFDKTEYMKFKSNGINTVYYLPLCANAQRLRGNDLGINYRHDISFVGSLYTEKKHNFYDRMTHISPYTRGYLEGLIASQKKIYGCNFIEDALTEEIMNDMSVDLPMEADIDSVESREYLFGQYVINRHITALERQEAFRRIGSEYIFDLYTYEKDITFPNCVNHGPVDFYDRACEVFRSSKINMNITLRSITTGIPLRAFEIMGSEGFLLTNYQADFDDCYTAFEDYVYYEDSDDMMAKIEYYLDHEKERREIAANGYQKTLNNHTYENRITQILDAIRQN